MEGKLGTMMYRLHSHLSSDSSYLDTFNSIITDRNKFKFVYQQLKKFDLFPAFIKDGKSDIESVALRKTGNRDYFEGRYLEALMNFTRSAACAESGAALAVAYGSRSACLFMLGLYQECIQDIDRAFTLDFTDLVKLMERRKNACFLIQLAEEYHEPVPDISERNSQVPSFSSSIKIENNQEFGKHVVATRDIRIGEVVAVEKPLACVLLTDHLLHCHHCLNLCYNPIPCTSCTQAFFCSEECLNSARNSYHKYECPLLLTFANCDTILLSLRVALSSEELPNLSIGQLEDQDKHYVTAMAAVLFHHLKTRTDLFDDEAAARFQENIVKIMLILRFNGSGVSEYRPQIGGDYKQTFFGAAIYPFSSLFNHSCCENVNKYYYGSTVVIKAVKSVKKGEQVFINYGFPYDVYAKEQRQMELEKLYNFKCNCQACVEDWKPHLVQRLQGPSVRQIIQKKFLSADVNAAKKWLPYLIPLLEQCERREPQGNALTLRKMICNCFDSLGNKRRI